MPERRVLAKLRLTAPGEHELALSNVGLLTLVVVGAGGGGSAAYVEGHEATRGGPGQDSNVRISSTSLSNDLDVIAQGGQGGPEPEPGERGQNGQPGEAVTVTRTNLRDVRLMITIGHGGRGGIVTEQLTAHDGTTGGHGSVAIVALE